MSAEKTTESLAERDAEILRRARLAPRVMRETVKDECMAVMLGEREMTADLQAAAKAVSDAV